MPYTLRHFYEYRFLLYELVRKGIRLKYRRSYLGIIWSLIEPLMTTAVLVIVFGTILGTRTPEFSLYIVAGRLCYSCFSSCTKGTCRAIRSNAAMIRKVYVPKYLYPLAATLFNYIIFLISLLVLLPVMVYARVLPTRLIWQMPAALILLLLINIGIGMILATLHVFFRDIEYLWNVVLMLIMYMSAIFYYPDKLLDSEWGFVLRWNPLYCIIDIFRGGVMGYQAMTYDFVFATGFALAALIVGLICFRWKQDEFILYI